MRLPLRAELPVDPRSPRRARRLLTEWLDRAGFAPAAAQDLVVAVNEAVTNSVEHAYPPGHDGTITVDAVTVHTEPDGIYAVVTVTDDGLWKSPDADRGFRGRGLAMMKAFVRQLHVVRTATGTQVRMTSFPDRQR